MVGIIIPLTGIIIYMFGTNNTHLDLLSNLCCVVELTLEQAQQYN